MSVNIMCLRLGDFYSCYSNDAVSKLCRALALCFDMLQYFLFPPLPKPGLSFPSLFVLRRFSADFKELSQGTIWPQNQGIHLHKRSPPALSFPRALASPSVLQIPAAPSAAGTLLHVLADCTASQGTPWGRGFVLWHGSRVVELSACLRAFLEVLTEESWLERIIGQVQSVTSVVVPSCLGGRRRKAVVYC